MKVATKLQAAFALYIVVLAVTLGFHVRTAQRAVARGDALTSLAERARVIGSEQVDRIADASTAAEKYLVTRDSGYLVKLRALVTDYGSELRRLDSLTLSPEERARVDVLTPLWQTAVAEATGFGARVDARAVARLEQAFDDVRGETERLANESRVALTRQLAVAEHEARRSQRIAAVVALGAIVLGVLLSAMLARSIVRPLQRLARGTHEIAAGRFEYRVDAGSGGELGQVARDFNAMAEKLAELDRMKREFVSNVSHDLKTPLSSMQEATEVLLDELAGPLTNKQRHLLLLNQDSGHRLSSMIAKLLEMSRLEATPPPALGLVDLVRLTQRAVDRANGSHPRAVEPRVELLAPARELPVNGDGDRLGQVLDNLLENALKFSPESTTVTVALDQRDDNVVVSVADEGPGVPDAEKERIFERFYQSERGRSSRARGVGLGLAICRHIATAHGGSIRVIDHEPRGAVFLLSLPAPPVVTRDSALPAVEDAA
jgi:signal transduction histidine kinase